MCCRGGFGWSQPDLRPPVSGAQMLQMVLADDATYDARGQPLLAAGAGLAAAMTGNVSGIRDQDASRLISLSGALVFEKDLNAQAERIDPDLLLR